MRNSVARNYVYNLSYQMLTLLTPLITTPYLARVLGPEGIGEYSFSYSVVAYFVLLAQFGITQFALREIAYHQEDPEARSRIFFEVIGFQIFTVTVSLLSYYFLGEYWGAPSEIYWVQALHIIAVLFDVSWFFQGMEEFGKIVFRNFVVRFVNIAILFLFVKSPEDLVFYAFLMGVMNVVSGLLIAPFLVSYVHLVPLRTVHPFRHWKSILQLFLPQVAIQIYVVMDKTMLGYFSDVYTESGYYEQADKVIKLLLTIVTSLGAVMLPRVAATVAQGDMEKVRRYMMASYQFSFFLAVPMGFGLLAMASNFVPWFFGPGYEPVALVMMILSSVPLAISLSNVTGIQFMVPMNRQNQLTLSVVIGAVFNFCINLYLIPHYFALGVALATMLTEWLVTAVQFYLVRDFFRAKDVLMEGKNYIASGLIMLAAVGLLASCLTPSMVHTVLIAAVGALLYGGLLWRMKDSMVHEMVNKIRMRLW